MIYIAEPSANDYLFEGGRSMHELRNVSSGRVRVDDWQDEKWAIHDPPVRSGPLTQVGVTTYYCSNRVCERVTARIYRVDEDRARLIRRLNLSLVSASSE